MGNYFDGTGTHQKKADILLNKYIKGQPRDKAKPTGDADATRALNDFARLSNRYYRFYNDGDGFRFKGKSYSSSRDRYAWRQDAERVERAMDRQVMKAWAATDGATI